MKKMLFWLFSILSMSCVLADNSIIVGPAIANDPYFQMNSVNLNTMNSYIIPVEGNIDPTNYPDRQYKLQRDASGGFSLVNNFDKRFDTSLKDGLSIHWMSSYNGMVLMWVMLIVFGLVVRYRKQSGFTLLFISMFEWIWDTFEDLMGSDKPLWMKKYVIYTFFIILISNLFGVVNDVIRFVVPWWLRNVTNPTGEFEFNLALALIATIITLVVQAKNIGFFTFLHEYLPITGKGLVDGKGFGSKLGDIVISLFTGLLDIVGIFSKVISLSMRLFGNMSSGSILLNVAFVGLGGFFAGLTSMNLVLGIPIIIYIQGLLGAFVQAFVFCLLVGLGLKMADE